jgi:predicted 2-oxoglutarate/Fe(II)-dependent dioxygenase YbiX
MNSFEDDSPWKVKPGHFGGGPENIHVLENFIEIDDLKAIQEFCPTINKWNNTAESVYAEDGTCLYNADYWNDRQCSADIMKELNPAVYDIVDKYIYKMKYVIEDIFKVSVSVRPPVIMKWRVGIEQKPHADKQLNDGRPNAFIDYDINSLFYYNDDFEGGDLYYPQHGITVRPKPGLAVIHPGDVNYLHGVTMITAGERYTTPSFYTIVDE